MKYKLLIISITSFTILNFALGSWGIMETSEARYAEISKEMLENNDFVNPMLLNIHHFHKPPLTYYITDLGYELFGVNEFGARFFLQFAIVLQLLLVFKITLLLFKDSNIAFAATLIYFSLPIVLISSRNLTTDAYLNTFIFVSIYFWLYHKIKSKKVIYIYLFYLFLGLIFETKGPVGLLFPIVFIIVYKLTSKKPFFNKNIHHIIGGFLFLFIASLWYITLIAENSNIFDYFIKDQLVNRMVSKSFNRAKPFWFYFATIPFLGLPWVFIVINYFKKQRSIIKKEKKAEYILYITILVLVVLFSIFKTKLILYILPVFGFIAILAAKILVHSNTKTLIIYNKIIIATIVTILIGFMGINFYKTAFRFNMFYSVILIVLSLVCVTYILKYKFKTQYLKTAVLSYAYGCILLISGTLFLIQNSSKLNSAKEVISYINTIDNVDNIVVYNYLLPSAKFYSKKNVVTLNDGHNTVKREIQFENNSKWKDNLINLNTKNGIKRAASIINNNSVLITRKNHELHDDVLFLKKNLIHSKNIGNWILYF